MRKIFDHPVCGKDAAKQLLSLRQGSQIVAEMACEFRTLAAESGWDEEPLQEAFMNSLTQTVSQPQVCSEPEPMQLGRTRLSPEERQRRADTRSCLYCGEVGHLVSTCSLRPVRRGSGDYGENTIGSNCLPIFP